jgi:CDP-glucose 4,6-dehydratase
MSYWKGTRVLITGVDGFVGTALANALIREDAQVSGLLLDYNFGSPFYRTADYLSLHRAIHGDIRDYRVAERAIVESNPDYIFHLAAITQVVDAVKMPAQNYAINIMGTVNLLDALRIQGRGNSCATVVASTDKVYGPPTGEPANEDTPLNPVHPYGVSKASMDMISQSYARIFHLPVAIARCGNIYGPGDVNWQRIIPGVIRWLLRGERPIIRSSGEQVREYNYIDDIVDAYLKIARGLMNTRFGTGTCFTISDDKSRLTALEIVDMIKNIMDREGIDPEILGGAEDEEEALILDSSFIQRRLGWRPRVPMLEGLKDTVDWLRYFLTETGDVI